MFLNDMEKKGAERGSGKKIPMDVTDAVAVCGRLGKNPLHWIIFSVLVGELGTYMGRE